MATSVASGAFSVSSPKGRTPRTSPASSPPRPIAELTSGMELAAHEPGVWPDMWLEKAITNGYIRSDHTIGGASIQPASLDLRLGEVAYRLRCSFLPDDRRVEDKLAEYSMGTVDLSKGAILERNRPYLVPLVEELALPDYLRAKANPKSSTGRLDIFTRVVCDKSYRFDEVPAGYRGKLYLEIVSRSFTIKVDRLLSLNQLRLMVGRAPVRGAELGELHRVEPILYLNNKPREDSALKAGEGLFLSLNLRGEENGIVGYRAKRNSMLLDLSRVDAYEVEDFWEPVYRDKAAPRVVLEPEEFYLLLSAESVRIPPAYAAEMAAYDPTSGELRTHYAGFFDPGFGHDEAGLLRGSQAALEVRAHDVPFMVEHGQRVCKLKFEKMREAPAVLYGAELGSNYQGQKGTLSKHFRVPGRREPEQLPLSLGPMPYARRVITGRPVR